MQVTTEDGIKITLTESQLAEIQAQIPPRPTYEKGTWVYVKAKDHTDKTEFLAQMTSDTAWDIPRNQWSGCLSWSSDVADIIRPWKPKAGDIVLLTHRSLSPGSLNYYTIAKMYDDEHLMTIKQTSSGIHIKQYRKVEPYIQQEINL